VAPLWLGNSCALCNSDLSTTYFFLYCILLATRRAIAQETRDRGLLNRDLGSIQKRLGVICGGKYITTPVVNIKDLRAVTTDSSGWKKASDSLGILAPFVKVYGVTYH